MMRLRASVRVCVTHYMTDTMCDTQYIYVHIIFIDHMYIWEIVINLLIEIDKNTDCQYENR